MKAIAARLTARKEVIILMVILILAAFAFPAFAQTNTPVPPPTATPVPSLSLPTGVLFSETNNWLETFAPIAAIGIGITIALAVLGYLGKLIVNAFKG